MSRSCLLCSVLLEARRGTRQSLQSQIHSTFTATRLANSTVQYSIYLCILFVFGSPVTCAVHVHCITSASAISTYRTHLNSVRRLSAQTLSRQLEAAREELSRLLTRAAAAAADPCSARICTGPPSASESESESAATASAPRAAATAAATGDAEAAEELAAAIETQRALVDDLEFQLLEVRTTLSSLSYCTVLSSRVFSSLCLCLRALPQPATDRLIAALRVVSVALSPRLLSTCVQIGRAHV